LWSCVQLAALVAEAVVDCYDEDEFFAGHNGFGLARIERSGIHFAAEGEMY